MKIICLAIFCVICVISCQTFIKDKAEIEKIVEDGTKEIIEDLENVAQKD